MTDDICQMCGQALVSVVATTVHAASTWDLCIARRVATFVCPRLSLAVSLAAGARMRYPTSYILVHGDTEAEIIQQNGGVLPIAPSQLAQASGISVANQQTSSLAAEAVLKRAATGQSLQHARRRGSVASRLPLAFL